MRGFHQNFKFRRAYGKDIHPEAKRQSLASPYNAVDDFKPTQTIFLAKMKSFLNAAAVLFAFLVLHLAGTTLAFVNARKFYTNLCMVC